MAEQPEAPQAAEEEGNLTIADLQTISNIIDIAMTRGASRANEARSVGESYDKIAAFLQNVQRQAEEQQAAVRSVLGASEDGRGHLHRERASGERGGEAPKPPHDYRRRCTAGLPATRTLRWAGRSRGTGRRRPTRGR